MISHHNMHVSNLFPYQCYGDLTESITGVRDDAGHSILLDALRESSSSSSSSSSYGQHSAEHLGADCPQRAKAKAKAKATTTATTTTTTTATAKSENKGADTEPALLKLSTAELLARCHRSIAEAESKFQERYIKSDEGETDSRTRGQSSNVKSALETCASDTDRTSKSEVEKGKFNGESTNPMRAVGTHGVSNGYFHVGSPSKLDEQTIKNFKANGSGLVVLVQVVTSVFRHLSLPCSKIASVMLLVRLGMKAHDDEVALKRVMPCLLLAMSDPSSSVRALAVRAVTAILSSVRAITPFESNIFPQYLFAPISVLAKDVEMTVRIAFAECLGSLAENARRFLEKAHLIAMAQAVADAAATSSGDNGSKFRTSSHSRGDVLHADTPASTPVPGVSVTPSCVSLDGVHVEFPYDVKLKALHDQVIRWIREVSSPPTVMGMVGAHSHSVSKSAESASKATMSTSTGGSLVKRALLEDIGRLCIFFGQEATTDLLLTQVLTFLNDQVFGSDD